jgi:hypothetical protein
MTFSNDKIRVHMHFTDANGNKQRVVPVLTQKTFELNDNFHHYSHAGIDYSEQDYNQGFVITDHTISNDTDSQVYVVTRHSNNDSSPIRGLYPIKSPKLINSYQMIVPGMKIILEIRQGQDLIESIDCGFVENMEISSNTERSILRVPENDYGIDGVTFTLHRIIDELPYTFTHMCEMPKSFDNVKYISISSIYLSPDFDKSIYQTIIEEIDYYHDDR